MSKISRGEFLKLLAAGGMMAVGFGAISMFAATDKQRTRNGLLSSALAQTPGSWSLGPQTSIVAIHASLLQDGRIFYFAGSGYNQSHTHGPYEARILQDVDSGSESAVSMDKDLFCGGHCQLANGNFLIAGGTLLYDIDPASCNGKFHGLPDVYEFDVATGNLIVRPSMAEGRWYGTFVTLPDGKVLAYSGYDEYGAFNLLTEVYDPATSMWTIKYDSKTNTIYCAGQNEPCPGAGSPCYGGTKKGVAPGSPGYARMHVMPSGLVALTGFNATARTWNPATAEWKVAGTTSMYRHYGCSILLPLNNTTTERGKVMLAGGSITSADNATTSVEILDFNASGNDLNPTIRSAAPLQYARKFASHVILPNGKVVIFGGTLYGTTTNYRYVPEMFDPVTETWTSLPASTVPRTYHHVSVLLPDGRVWTAGGTSGRNRAELRTEIYSPDYCFASRPTISGTPSVGAYGNKITIPTPNAANITSVSLNKVASTTHHYDQNQRLIWLQIVSKSAASVQVSAPINGKIAPPGYYMLSVLNSSGVPSVSAIIKIPGTGTGTGDDIPPTISAPADVTAPGTGVHTDFRQSLPVSQVFANGFDFLNIPQNVLDGDLSTRWSNSSSGSWIIADLGTSVAVSDIDIAWYLGDQRTSNFTIAVSNDGIVYKSILTTTSSGNTTSKEKYSFTHTVARYVRITVNESNAGITEIGINGYSSLGIPTVNDNLDSSPLITNNYPPGGFLAGVTNLVWTATDVSGNSASDTQNVTITDSDVPSQVTGLSASASGALEIDLAWNDNQDGDLNHYNVYRDVTSGFAVDDSTVPIAQVTPNSFADTTVNQNTTYYYKVAAVDNAGNRGIPSAEASASTGLSDTFYNVSLGDTAAAINGGTGNSRYGIEIASSSSAIRGKSLKKLTVYLRKNGSPSGNVTATVRSSSDTIVASFTQVISASSLPTSYAPQVFTLASPYTLQTGDKILIEYSGPAKVEMSIWGVDKFDGSKTRRTRYASGSYGTSNTQDISAILSNG